MDSHTVQQNEQRLGDLLEKGDKKFVALVAVTALGLLTEQMTADQYSAFLSDAVENASQIQKHKMLNSQEPKSTEGRPQTQNA